MNDKTKRLTTTAVVAALVYVITMLIVIPVPAIKGAYFNLGDVIIYCAAFLLGGPYAAIAAALGSGLADLTLGSALYAPATVVIKGLMALAAGAITKKPNLSKYILACVVGGLIMAGGYGLYEVIIFGASAAVLTVVPNLIQAACGIVIASALYKPMQLLRNKIGLRNTK